MKTTEKKRGVRLAMRIILGMACMIFIAAASVIGFFGIKGYQMYQEAVKETPISQIGEAIRSQDGFTTYDELPPIYIDAVIAAEDKRFESHCGIDPIAIARALWIDLTTLSFKEGGSTITQQIAKNQLFTQEKRMERKAAEVFAVFALEKEYSKKELFELYVNSIYFGSGYYGIHDASRGYFGKDPRELTDYEAVLLAGLPNAPSVYSLNNSVELAQKRMAVVLRRMIKCDKITEEEAEELLKQEHTF